MKAFDTFGISLLSAVDTRAWLWKRAPMGMRRYKRYRVEVEFWCRNESAIGELTLETGDVSVGGAFLKSEVLLDEGDRLEIEVPVSGRAAPIRAEARVAWVRRFFEDGEPPGMGIEFMSISKEDQATLEKMIARRAKG